MLEKLIKICVHKVGSKRQLGIELGYKAQYAGQSVDKLLAHQNPKWEIVEQLLVISEINDHFNIIINHFEINIPLPK